MRVGKVIVSTVAVVAPLIGLAGTAHADNVPGLVGGHASTDKTPWMASIQYDAPDYGVYDWHTCGGVLAVARDVVISNAHCFDDPPAGASVEQTAGKWRMDETSLTIPTAAKKFKVRLGSKNRTQGGVLVNVKAITLHPDWNWAIGAPQVPVADIAVLRLEHSVDLQQVQLARSAAQAGDSVSLYGWGIDTPASTGDLPTRLQALVSSVIAPARCADVGISWGEICVDNPSGTDGVCYGDSGGPAIRWRRDGVPELVGGVSRAAGELCGETPSAFTSQPDYRPWLYDVISGRTASRGVTASRGHEGRAYRFQPAA